MSLTPSTMLDLGTSAPDFTLPEANGGTVSLNDFSGSAALLVMFICNHCPYVIHLREALKELATEYKPKNVAVVAINSNDTDNYPDDSFEKMKNENYPFPYLFDETQQVAKAYQAACTPDFFLFDSQKKLIYRGQFDETRPNRPSRPAPELPITGKDMRTALDALLAGGTPTADQIPSVGCNIKWKAGNEA